MNKNVTKLIAAPVLAATAFVGVGFFANGSNGADVAVVSVPVDDVTAEQLALTTTDEPVVEAAVEVVEDVKPELVVPDQLQEAFDKLQHSIDMANEVRIAMLHRIGIVEIAQRNDAPSDRKFLAINWVLPENELDQQLHDTIVETLTNTKSRMAEIIENSGGDYAAAEAQLNQLREDLVKVYEPYGPYENPFNYPPQWLAALPNGDPRWLPYNSVQHIGPEMIRTSHVAGTANLEGNNGEAPGDITQQYAISIEPIIECFGPKPEQSFAWRKKQKATHINDKGYLVDSSGNIDMYWRTAPWERRKFPNESGNGVCREMYPYTIFQHAQAAPRWLQPGQGHGFVFLDNVTFFHYNQEKQQFENLISLFDFDLEDKFSGPWAAADASSATLNASEYAVRVNHDSTLIRGNLDFERDENGFVVFRPMTNMPNQRLELILALGNTGDETFQIPQGGSINRVWDWVYQGPDQASGGKWRLFAPYERSFPATAARLAETDPELAVILAKFDDAEWLADWRAQIAASNPNLTGNWDWGPGPDYRP